MIDELNDVEVSESLTKLRFDELSNSEYFNLNVNVNLFKISSDLFNTHKKILIEDSFSVAFLVFSCFVSFYMTWMNDTAAYFIILFFSLKIIFDIVRVFLANFVKNTHRVFLLEELEFLKKIQNEEKNISEKV